MAENRSASWPSSSQGDTATGILRWQSPPDFMVPPQVKLLGREPPSTKGVGTLPKVLLFVPPYENPENKVNIFIIPDRQSYF